MKKYIILAFLLVLFLWASSAIVLVYYYFPASENAWSMRGQFGDMFGAVNALFSGLALTAIAITVYLQYRDLKDQGEVLQKQSELLEYQLQREEHLVRQYIAGQPAGRSPEVKSIFITNYGQRIVNIDITLIEPASGLKIQPTKVHRLKMDEQFELHILGYKDNKCPEVKLEFSYINYLGKRGKSLFLVPEGKSQELVYVREYEVTKSETSTENNTSVTS